MLGRVPRLTGAAVLAAVVAGAACSEDEAPARDTVAIAVEPSTSSAPRERARVSTELAQQLEALGYVSARPAHNPDVRGVTSLATDSRGYNVYCSRDRASAALTDMAGNVLHRWTASEEEADRRTWMHVEPQPDGSLFVITRDRDLTKYDRHSRIVWRARLRAHHDLALHEDGRVLVLVRRRRHHSFRGQRVPILADSIAVLSPEGDPLKTIDLLPLSSDSIAHHRLARIARALEDGEPIRGLVRPGGVGDVLHANSIDLLHRDIPGIAPAGSILLSFRATSRVMIIDAEGREVLWTWGAGELQQQHDARQLENGNLMIFDNGIARRQSRVIELSAATGEIVWSYTDPELFSRIRGGAQPLPNGNVLVTESEEGHALEVTRDGEVVWEFWNPDVRDGFPPRRAVIYRLNRFPETYFEPDVEW